jgi:uncharacterized protein YbaA (DUF1428 family)
MYVNGFVIPVPADKKDAYTKVAEDWWPIALDHGALSQVECWEEDVPDGKQTDFRRAVNLQPGEKVVFSWVTWPDRATADLAHDKMMADPRMEAFTTPEPFDAARMIFGGFSLLVVRQA